MQLGALLDDIDLGHDAAENDRVLDKAFVKTEAFFRLIHDDVDLITGLKGTGKSALYRMLTEHSHQFEQLQSVRVVKAGSPMGSPVFLSLFTEQATELRLRSVWTAYFASLVANEVVDQHSSTPTVRHRVAEIAEVLALLGLREADKKPKSLLQRILEAKSFEPNVTTDGTLLTFGLKFDVADPVGPESRVTIEFADLLALLKSCDEVLHRVGESIWVAVDRVDECFTRDSEVERRALRALLRTMLDITSELGLDRRVGLKVFLRTDLLRRMSSDVAFTNSTHLRMIELQWNDRDIQDIVVTRVLRSQKFEEVWPQPRAQPLRASVIWGHLVPERFASGHKESLHEICAWTADGHRGYNPRNALTLLRFALQRKREDLRGSVGDTQVDPTVPLLDEPVLASALGKLSRKRLTDTVLNEFPGLEYLVAALERKPASYESRDALLSSLGLAEQPRAVQDGAIDLLVLSGVLGRNGQQFIVPRLYRAALKSPIRPRPRR